MFCGNYYIWNYRHAKTARKCHCSCNQQSISYCGRPCSIPCQAKQDFFRADWHRDRFLSQYLGLPHHQHSKSAIHRRHINLATFIVYNALKPVGQYMYHKVYHSKFYLLPTRCIYLFCEDLRTNSDFFPLYTALADWCLYTEAESVLCAVRTESLTIFQISLCLQRVK